MNNEPLVLKVSDLVAMLGLSRTTLYRLIAAKAFPKPVNLSPRRVGWLAATVDDWLTARSKK
ncbi:MAG: AlpA family phage regulatory protein [Accumulibacter sp.]|uniref:helix-turn-helix transcriptional regulator n=1 Tax=Accumulibacter sp. TaxID=2053492 RepID=UPI0033153C01